jgi:hypothetical protein
MDKTHRKHPQPPHSTDSKWKRIGDTDVPIKILIKLDTPRIPTSTTCISSRYSVDTIGNIALALWTYITRMGYSRKDKRIVECDETVVSVICTSDWSLFY